MPECTRCGDFADNPPTGEYHYGDHCQNTFRSVPARRHYRTDGRYHVCVTAEGICTTAASSRVRSTDSGETSRRLDVDALFVYTDTGSRWLLPEYLQTHPEIRQDVTARLGRVPERNDGLLKRVRSVF